MFTESQSATANRGVHRTLRACLLLRKSNTPDEDNCSLETQRRGGLSLIAQNGWQCDPSRDVIVQVVSGWQKKANREKIAELVELTTSGRYDVVVLFKLDRFGRRVPEVTAYYEAMADARVLLASATEGVFDLTYPTQLAFAQMMIVHAQLESGNNSVRVSTTRQHKRTQGFWQGGIPYGWEIDAQVTAGGDKIYARAANGSKRLRRKAGEAETVDYIVRLADVEGLNAGSIAKRLNAERVPTRKDGAKWTDKTVRRILVNPTLAGWVAEWDYDPSTHRPVAWSVHPLRDKDRNPVQLHEPAVTPQEYERLYARFGPRTVNTRDRSGRALLTGLLFCGNHPDGRPAALCGGRLTGSAVPGPRHKYHCPHDDDPTRCRGNHVSQVPVEGYVTSLFIALISSGDFARRHAQLVAAALTRGNDRTSSAQQELAGLTELAEVHRVAAQQAQTARAAQEASANYDRTLQRIEQVKAALVDAEPAPALLTAFADLDGPRCLALFQAANRDQQRRWLAAVIDRVQVLPARGRGAQKGAFGSRGFDPRRVRIYLRHDPTHPIVAPEDWQGTAPDFGGPARCPDCGHECKNRAALAAHRRWKHGRVSEANRRRGLTAAEYPCPERGCAVVLYNEAAVRNHLWHRHDKTDGYTCPQCNRVFALPAGVGRHLSTVHSQQREFCEICGGTFKAGGLSLHIRRVHSAPARPAR